MVTVLKEGFDARAAAQKVKLICLDLDGTLCARDKSIPAANADAIRRAREAGITVAVASGRHPFNVRELMDGLGLPFCAVCLSGAIAVLDGETVFAHPCRLHLLSLRSVSLASKRLYLGRGRGV